MVGYLRWSCSEQKRTENHNMHLRYLFFIIIYLAKYTIIFVIYKYGFIILLNATVVFYDLRFDHQKCLSCKIVQNALTMVLHTSHELNQKQSKIKNNLKLTWGCDVMLWGHNEYVWGQRSILEHVWHSEVTMNYIRGLDMSLEVKTNKIRNITVKIIITVIHN